MIRFYKLMAINISFWNKHRPHFEMKRDVFKTNMGGLRNKGGWSVDECCYGMLLRPFLFQMYFTVRLLLIACWHRKLNIFVSSDGKKTGLIVSIDPVNVLGYKILISFSLQSNKSSFSSTWSSSAMPLQLHPHKYLSLLPSPRLSPQLLKRFLSICWIPPEHLTSQLFLLNFT